jgi:transposase
MKKNETERRHYSDDLKREAVQMLVDGYFATSIASNLGIRNANLIHKWKKKELAESPVAETLDTEVRDLREKLARVERERDILKKALSIFSQRM